MYGRRIGNAAKEMYAKLSQNLAGPFATFLPQPKIENTLDELSCRVVHSAFSPLGHDLGLHRSSA